MKKISLLLVLVAIFVTFSSFLVSQDRRKQDIVLKLSIGKVEKGIAEDGDTVYYRRVRPGSILREGEYLKTGDSSNATLKIGNDIIKIEQQATVKLERIKDNWTTLKVLQGTVVTKVSKLTEGGQFNVSSPSAVAGVRGTSFTFSYNRETTEGSVEVSEGIVEVGNSKVENKSVLLNRNEKIYVTNNVDPTEIGIDKAEVNIRKKSADEINDEEGIVDIDLFDEDFDIEY